MAKNGQKCAQKHEKSGASRKGRGVPVLKNNCFYVIFGKYTFLEHKKYAIKMSLGLFYGFLCKKKSHFFRRSAPIFPSWTVY